MQLKFMIMVFSITIITSGLTSVIVWWVLNQYQIKSEKGSQSNNVQDIVKAKEFQVIDGSGKKRIILGYKDGAARVEVLGSSGKAGAQLLVADTDTPALIIGDSEEEETGKIALMVEDKEWPTFLITDKYGMTKIALKIDIDDLPKLILAGKVNEMSHEPQAILFFKDGVIPKLKFSDSDYEVLWETP